MAAEKENRWTSIWGQATPSMDAKPTPIAGGGNRYGAGLLEKSVSPPEASSDPATMTT